MHDDGQKIVKFFWWMWTFHLLILISLAFLQIGRWEPGIPFSILEVLRLWLPIVLALGLCASTAAWWQATAEIDPRRRLSAKQVVGWIIGHSTYVVLVLVFYSGVFTGLIFALDSAFQRYPEPVPFQVFSLKIGSKYLFLIIFGAVAVGQTTAIGTSMARSFVALLDNWLKINRSKTDMNLNCADSG